MSRFCRDCRHLRPGALYPNCAAGAREIDLVTGEPKLAWCSVLRLEGQACGPEGALFERALERAA
jgi:hypothetical protein